MNTTRLSWHIRYYPGSLNIESIICTNIEIFKKKFNKRETLKEIKNQLEFLGYCIF